MSTTLTQRRSTTDAEVLHVEGGSFHPDGPGQEDNADAGRAAAGGSGPFRAGGSRQPARGSGLSTAHNSPEEGEGFELITHRGGTFTKLAGIGRSNGGGARGKVGGFSRASRQRLQRKLASINEEDVQPHRSFVTLTYPGQYPACGREWKRHLDVFIKRLERAYDVQAIVWKLEPQDRMAPHYHLLVFADALVDKAWLSQAWYEVVGSQRVEHLAAGTQCQEIRSWKGVLSYASKYIGKVHKGKLPLFWADAGRWWGVRGKLPIEPITQSLTRREGFKVRRVMRKFLRRKYGRPIKVWEPLAGLACYLSDVDALRLAMWCLDPLPSINGHAQGPPTIERIDDGDLPY